MNERSRSFDCVPLCGTPLRMTEGGNERVKRSFDYAKTSLAPLRMTAFKESLSRRLN
jgi:hypothetical protein